jgi:hypothetical protein
MIGNRNIVLTRLYPSCSYQSTSADDDAKRLVHHYAGQLQQCETALVQLRRRHSHLFKRVFITFCVCTLRILTRALQQTRTTRTARRHFLLAANNGNDAVRVCAVRVKCVCDSHARSARCI